MLFDELITIMYLFKNKYDLAYICKSFIGNNFKIFKIFKSGIGYGKDIMSRIDKHEVPGLHWKIDKLNYKN